MKLPEYKIILTFFFLISFKTVLSQKSLSITYTIETKFDLEEMRDTEAQEMSMMVSDIMSDFEFQLMIDGGESIFKQSEQLVRDDINPLSYKLATGFCSGNEVWHTKKGDTIKRVALLDSNPLTILILNEEVKWEILNKTKYIGKFKVIKATTTRKLGSNYVEKIDVWFAPELPYSFGPLGYNGLPGLILEMHRDNIVYKFKEVEEKNISIKFPKGSKEMTFEEYYKILDANMAEIKKRG